MNTSKARAKSHSGLNVQEVKIKSRTDNDMDENGANLDLGRVRSFDEKIKAGENESLRAQSAGRKVTFMINDEVMQPEQFSFEDDSGSIFEEENKHLNESDDDEDDDDAEKLGSDSDNDDDDLGSDRNSLEDRVGSIEPKQELYLEELEKIDELYQKIEQDI